MAELYNPISAFHGKVDWIIEMSKKIAIYLIITITMIFIMMRLTYFYMKSSKGSTMVQNKKKEVFSHKNNVQLNKKEKVEKIRYNEKTMQKILLCQKEYELVANKVTTLSMNFLRGTYLIPISLVVASISEYFSKDTYVANIILIFLPLVLSIYGYNHIRYMTLHMKAGEYCSHLEEEINKYYEGENILLWENRLARDSNQIFFEFWLFFIVYGINFTLLYVFGYNSLIECAYSGFIRDEIAILIAISYLAVILFALLFLLLFTRSATKRIRDRINIDKKIQKLFDENQLRKRIYMLLVIVILLLPTAGLPLIYSFQHNKMQEIEDIDWESIDTIIVLGNKLNNGNLSEDGILRMNGLIRCLDKQVNSNVKVVLTGGNGEAEAMKEYLGDLAEKSNIECESDSETTFQNLKNTANIVSGKTIVITSDYHVLRTHMLIRKFELNYEIVPVATNRQRLLSMWRECYRILVDMLKWA